MYCGMVDIVRMQLFDDGETLARAAAESVADTVAESIAARGACHLVLAGGHTPQRCYELLRDMEVDWAGVHIYFGDERCLPAGDGGRNDVMADTSLCDHVSIPALQIHRIDAELGAEAAAESYATLLEGAPPMDLALLGMGEDGHTASLFPEHPALRDDRLAIPVHGAPKPPPDRVSMGYRALNRARRRMILVSGRGKREALQRVRGGEMLPVARLAASEWFVDRAAAGTD